MRNCPRGAPPRLSHGSPSVSLLDGENSRTARECRCPLRSRTLRWPAPCARSPAHRRPSAHMRRCGRSWSSPVFQNQAPQPAPARTKTRREMRIKLFVSYPPLNPYSPTKFALAAIKSHLLLLARRQGLSTVRAGPLELESQSKLEGSRILENSPVDGVTGNCPEKQISHGRIRWRKARMVGEVERLRPHFHPHAFFGHKRLVNI